VVLYLVETRWSVLVDPETAMSVSSMD
jgi:hypothetical protein